MTDPNSNDWASMEDAGASADSGQGNSMQADSGSRSITIGGPPPRQAAPIPVFTTHSNAFGLPISSSSASSPTQAGQLVDGGHTVLDAYPLYARWAPRYRRMSALGKEITRGEIEDEDEDEDGNADGEPGPEAGGGSATRTRGGGDKESFGASTSDLKQPAFTFFTTSSDKPPLSGLFSTTGRDGGSTNLWGGRTTFFPSSSSSAAFGGLRTPGTTPGTRTSCSSESQSERSSPVHWTSGDSGANSAGNAVADSDMNMMHLDTPGSSPRSQGRDFSQGTNEGVGDGEGYRTGTQRSRSNPLSSRPPSTPPPVHQRRFRASSVLGSSTHDDGGGGELDRPVGLALGRRTSEENTSKGDDMETVSNPSSTPRSVGPVRRPVRRGNLYPKTKGFSRVMSSLQDESRPTEKEYKAEAALQRIIKGTDAPRTPRSSFKARQGATSLDDVDDDDDDEGVFDGSRSGGPGGTGSRASAAASSDSSDGEDRGGQGRARSLETDTLSSSFTSAGRGGSAMLESDDAESEAVAGHDEQRRTWLGFRDRNNSPFGGYLASSGMPRNSPGSDRGAGVFSTISKSNANWMEVENGPISSSGSGRESVPPSPSLWQAAVGRSNKRKLADDRFEEYSTAFKRRAVSPVTFMTSPAQLSSPSSRPPANKGSAGVGSSTTTISTGVSPSPTNSCFPTMLGPPSLPPTPGLSGGSGPGFGSGALGLNLNCAIGIGREKEEGEEVGDADDGLGRMSLS